MNFDDDFALAVLPEDLEQLLADFQRLMLFALLIREKVGSVPDQLEEIIGRYPALCDHLAPSVEEIRDMEKGEQ